MGKPIPDQSDEFIKSGMVLITDPRSDKYLQDSRKRVGDVPKNRLSKWCGGKNGFNDYVEWL